MKLFFAVFLAAVSSGVAMIACPPDICARVRCAMIQDADCDGKVDKHGGYCGCCPACIKQIGENERCVPTVFLLGAPKDSECADDLFCNRTSGVCEKKSCGMKLVEVNGRLDAAKQAGKPLLGVPVPSCETDGTYKPVQCTGSVCNCVNQKGEALFSDPSKKIKYSANVWEKASMNCGCALDQHKYMKTGLIGKMFNCEANGNYKKFACTGSVCYCADKFGKQVGTSSVNIGKLGSLNC